MKNDVSKFFDSLAPHWDEGITSPPLDLLLSSGIKKGNKVLDVACGTGIITPVLHSLCERDVLGIDISPKMIEIAKANHRDEKGVRFLCEDFAEFKGDGDYDLVVIYNAFPHFVDLNALKKALLRTLKKGGKAAILHSLSRKQLGHHHEGLGPSISRTIASPLDEARFFYPEFSLVLAKESDHDYRLVLEKD